MLRDDVCKQGGLPPASYLHLILVLFSVVGGMVYSSSGPLSMPLGIGLSAGTGELTMKCTLTVIELTESSLSSPKQRLKPRLLIF